MAEPSRYPNVRNIMNAKTSTGVGTAINVQDFKNIQLSIATSGNANFTIKIQGSMISSSSDPTLTTSPDFSASPSINNRWDYIATFDYLNPTNVVPGGTGYSSAGTDIYKNIIVNVDGLAWLNCEITDRSAGAISVDAVSFNNQ